MVCKKAVPQPYVKTEPSGGDMLVSDWDTAVPTKLSELDKVN